MLKCDMILLNGSPKTGTHLLARAISLFGERSITRGHKPYDPNFMGISIHIRRCPRNVIISAIRHFDAKRGVNDETILQYIPMIIKEMYGYIGWLSHPNTLNVTFEKILTDPNELERIRKFLSKPETHTSLFREVWGGTATFTGKLSNWRDHWTPKVSEAYKQAGGHTLENALGYWPDTDEILVRPADV